MLSSISQGREIKDQLLVNAATCVRGPILDGRAPTLDIRSDWQLSSLIL